MIEYKRGHIMVPDRAKLEAHACECYALVKKETDRLLGIVPDSMSRAAATSAVLQCTAPDRLEPGLSL